MVQPHQLHDLKIKFVIGKERKISLSFTLKKLNASNPGDKSTNNKMFVPVYILLPNIMLQLMSSVIRYL